MTSDDTITDYDSAAEAEFTRLLRSSAILVVDDEPGMRNFLKRALDERCALLEVAGSAEEAEAVRLRYHFDVLLVDIRLPGLSGLDWVARLRERGVRTHVIYMTAYADLDMAVSALRNGADDFIMKPFRAQQIIISIRRTLTRGQILRENTLLRLQLRQSQNSDAFVGDSAPVVKMLTQIQQLAYTRSCVLITGETGTGKALVARTLHDYSRRQGPLIVVNCSTLTDMSEEAELFGDNGYFVLSDKGSLLLVDVETLSMQMQARLVDMLDQGIVRLAGTVQGRIVDVRIMVSTHCDLGQEVEAGRFRGDLQYRLNALPVQVPPLRDRGSDIELLVDMFMHRFSTRLRLAPVELLHADWLQLNSYNWPGNVRELRNVVERILLLGELPADSLGSLSSETFRALGYPLDYDMEKVERAHMEAVLVSVGNNKSAAARILGVSRKTLERKQTLWSGSTM